MYIYILYLYIVLYIYIYTHISFEENRPQLQKTTRITETVRHLGCCQGKAKPDVEANDGTYWI